MSFTKRFTDYEILYELFSAKKYSLELTIFERIWLIIIELVALLSEILKLETENLFKEDKQLTESINFKAIS